ncbi:hypothetical protein Dimus_034194 [Dionaea muscipula]
MTQSLYPCNKANNRSRKNQKPAIHEQPHSYSPPTKLPASNSYTTHQPAPGILVEPNVHTSHLHISIHVDTAGKLSRGRSEPTILQRRSSKFRSDRNETASAGGEDPIGSGKE